MQNEDTQDAQKTPRQKLYDWFHAPETHPLAWRDLSLKQIAHQAHVSTTSVTTHLPAIVRQRYSQIASIREFNTIRKQHRRGTPGNTIPDADIKQIQQLRKTHTIHETAQITKRSPATVQKYSAKRYAHKGRKRQK